MRNARQLDTLAKTKTERGFELWAWVEKPDWAGGRAFVGHPMCEKM